MKVSLSKYGGFYYIECSPIDYGYEIVGWSDYHSAVTFLHDFLI